MNRKQVRSTWFSDGIAYFTDGAVLELLLSVDERVLVEVFEKARYSVLEPIDDEGV